MSIIRRSLILAAVGAAALPAAASAVRVQDVMVTNTADDPVPASIVGTPSVSLAGTPSVSLAGTPNVALAGTPDVNVANSPLVRIDPDANVVRLEGSAPAAPAGPAPFQAYLELEAEAGTTSFCGTVRAPTDAVATVQHVIATVNSTNSTAVRISYLPGAGNGRRFVTRLIEPGGPVAASLDTLMHLGLGTPDVVLQACLENDSTSRREADVLVTGTQVPAPGGGA